MGLAQGENWIHVAVLAVLIVGTATAGAVRLPVKPDPLARTLGWREIAAATRAEIAAAKVAGKPYASVVTDDRSITAELLYYMRAEPTPVLAWKSSPRPHDHFELTRPFKGGAQEPALLVTLGGMPVAGAPVKAGQRSVFEAFGSVAQVAIRDVPAGINEKRHVSFFALSGYKGP